jgi:hypothetical protein
MYPRAYRAHPEIVTDLTVGTSSGVLTMQTSRDRRMAIAGTMSVTEATIEDTIGDRLSPGHYLTPDTMADVGGIEGPNGNRTVKIEFTVLVERAHIDIIDHNTSLEMVGDLANMVEL